VNQGNAAGTVIAVLASAVVVLGGIAALVRAIWRTATTLRENTLATRALTEKFEEYTKAVDGRLAQLTDRLGHVETELGIGHHGRPGGP